MSGAVSGGVSGSLAGVFADNKVLGGAGAASGLLGGIFGIGNAIAQNKIADKQNEKTIFNSQQNIKQMGAQIYDIYNAPDNINMAAGSIEEIESYRSSLEVFFGKPTHTLRGFYMEQLPHLTSLKEYSDFLFKYGYISNNQKHLKFNEL
ncbi:MAG: hypothetical protein ACRCZZ_08570, partial [Phocaeicola sp.]